MKFWDSSAIVPVIIEEAQSTSCRALLRADPRIVVWALTRTEVTSALWRQHRESILDAQEIRRALARLDRWMEQWNEVEALVPVREQADRLLRLHRLRAADALQLGAALVAVDHRPRHRGFVSLDDALLDAADREGFEALRPAG